MVVWSDPRVQKLAKEFVCCTEEVDILFPRNAWLIKHLKDDPAVHLFRDVYGKQAPRAHWNPDPKKTKQGVYAMMADGTYLSGRFVGVRPNQVIDMMKEALTEWKNKVKKRELKIKPVPQTKALTIWKKKKDNELGLHIQFHCRDLPRKGTKLAGNGRTVGQHNNTSWIEFTKEEAEELVPKGEEWTEISKKLRDKIFCRGLKDIVYGQSPNWKPADVKAGRIRVKIGGKSSKKVLIDLEGEFNMISTARKYEGTLLGKLSWSPQKRRITYMQVAAIGMRSGKTTFNFRKGDEAPAPLGVSFCVVAPSQP